jgi:hypothetical protein
MGRNTQLLQFDEDRRGGTTPANLKALYGIEQAPGDTRFRERLDEVDPRLSKFPVNPS